MAANKNNNSDSSDIEEEYEDLSDGEFEQRAEVYEKELRSLRTKVLHSKSVKADEPFRCPYAPCTGRKIQWRNYVSIRQHAQDVAKSHNYKLIERVQHEGLANYLVKDLAAWEPPKKCKEDRFQWKRRGGDGGGGSGSGSGSGKGGSEVNV